MVKDLPADAGDMGLISDPRRFHMLRAKQACVPHLLSPRATAAAAYAPQSPCSATRTTVLKGLSSPQLERACAQQRRPTLLLLLLSCLGRVRLCATPQTTAHQTPQSLGFSRQEHWSGLPFPSPVHDSESEVAQSCLTLSDPMDCSLPGSSVHGIFQARVLEWVAIAFSKTQHNHK